MMAPHGAAAVTAVVAAAGVASLHPELQQCKSQLSDVASHHYQFGSCMPLINPQNDQ